MYSEAELSASVIMFAKCMIKQFIGIFDGSDDKDSTCNVGNLGLIPGLGRPPAEGNRYPLQYSGLENSMGLYSLWGHKESDTTDSLSLHFT